MYASEAFHNYKMYNYFKVEKKFIIFYGNNFKICTVNEAAVTFAAAASGDMPLFKSFWSLFSRRMSFALRH